MAGKILVFLENYHGVYYPGQTISGRVECFFTNEESFKAVKIRYDGRAETKWTESETYYDDFYKEERSRDVEYGDKEVYFSAEYILVQGGDNYTHPAGNHTFPFSYVLPQDLPASYEGTYGSVRYNIKAIIDRSWRSDDESEIPLNVASPLDLNYLSELREPVAMSVDSTPCSCWCQNSGPITFNVSLPAIGFAPGQEINIGAYIENMSNVSAESVTFEFFADFEYLVRTPRSRRYEENYITGCTEGGVGAHGDKSWTSTLTIPSDSSFPNLIPCSIIKVKYLLKARVKLPCPHSDLYARVELMIGSVPLTGVNTSLPGPPPLQGDSYSYNPTAPPIYGAPNIPDYSGNANNSTDGIILRPYPPEGASYPSGEIPYLSEGGPYSSIRPPHPSGVPPYPSGATPYAPGVTGWTVPTESIKETDSSSAPPSYEEAQQLKGKSRNAE